MSTSTLACRHCGDLCGPDARVLNDAPFCCHGCESVYRLLATHGLTDYYAGTTGISQRTTDGRPASRFAAFDDPIATARLVKRIGDVSRVTLQTPALHCASCLWLLEQLWKVDPGVRRVDASLLHRTVTVEFTPEKTTLRRIAEQLAALGYEPVIDAEPVTDRVPAERRRLYLQLGVAGFAFGNMMLFSIPQYLNGGLLEPEFQRLFDGLNLAFALPVLFYSAADYFTSASRALRASAITLDVPVALGLAVLFGRSAFEIVTRTGEGFLDSFAGLVFFLLIGKLFQRKAFDSVSFDRTARSFLPLSVRRLDDDGVATLVPIEQLRPGDTLLVRAHEVVPADAMLTGGTGLIDYAFVTGEQAPVAVDDGALVHAGGRVVGTTLRLTVTRAVAHSHLARLWTDPVFASAKAHWLDELLARFGRAFTISALFLAAAGAWWWWPDVTMSATVATAVLIIACPCAFTLAAPLTLGTAMGILGRSGVYVKSPSVVLDLSRITAAVFDKTGTLTTGTTADASDLAAFPSAERLLIQRLAAQSIHPASRAIAAGLTADGEALDVQETPGRGITGVVAGRHVALGSAAFVRDLSHLPVSDDAGGVWAWVEGGTPRPIRLSVAERPGIRTVIAGIASRVTTWLLSGDHAGEAGRWSSVFGDQMRFRLSPGDKLTIVRDLSAQGHRVLMVGDGLNDAGALAAADVGLAVSDDTACLVPACDAIVRGHTLSHLDALLAYARRARRVIALCFTVSLLYNAIGLGLALSGHLTPLATAILMPVSSLTIVGLAVLLMRRRPPLEMTA